MKPISRMLNQIYLRKSINIARYDLRHAKLSQRERHGEITPGPNFKNRCRSATDMMSVILRNLLRDSGQGIKRVRRSGPRLGNVPLQKIMSLSAARELKSTERNSLQPPIHRGGL